MDPILQNLMEISIIFIPTNEKLWWSCHACNETEKCKKFKQKITSSTALQIIEWIINQYNAEEMINKMSLVNACSEFIT